MNIGKMKPEEFILHIIKLYQNARIPRYVDQKIRRGRSHAISSLAEDLFASYLIASDSSVDLILVDQPVHIPELKVKFYPDITVIRKGKITAFLDLKMDLGWKRDGLIDLCLKDQKLIRSIRNLECSYKDGLTKDRMSYPIADTAVYDIVIISGENISKSLLKEQLEAVIPHRTDVAVHVLTTNEHPNTYGLNPDMLLEKLEINDSAFIDISKRIAAR